MLLSRLLLTIIIELIISLLIGIRNKKDILNIIVVNIMTNPIVVLIPLVIRMLTNNLYSMIFLFLLEVITLFIEGIVYKNNLCYKKINWFLLSLLLNMCSFLFGLILNIFY